MNGKLQQPLERYQQPFISIGGVKSILDSLTYNDPQRCYESMLGLTVVDQFLLQHASPRSENQRYYALVTILVDTITHEYHSLRETVMDETTEEPQSPAALLSMARDDANIANSFLLGWSILYAQYVHAPFDIPRSTLADAFGMTERNIRRYHQSGLQALTRTLVKMEQSAIQHVRAYRLRAVLPFQAEQTFGRDGELNDLWQRYLESTHQFVLITGRPGIGKTHLATAFAHQIVSHTMADHILWLHKPDNVEQIVSHLEDRLVRQFAGITLQDFNAVHDNVIILDQAEHILEDTKLLLATLGKVFLIAIATSCHAQATLSTVDAHIHLQPLAIKAAHELFDYKSDSTNYIAPRQPDILARGIPAEICASARQIEFDALTSAESFIVCDIAFSPGATLPPEEAKRLNQRQIVSLKERNIVQINVTGHVSITEEYRAQWTQTNMKHYVEYLTNNVPYSSSHVVSIAENVLTQPGNLTETSTLSLMKRCWRQAMRLGHISQWLAFMQRNSSLDLRVAEGALLGRSGKHQEAQRVLENVIQMSGQTGNFDLQAEALYELGRLMRRIGKLTIAQRIFSRLDATLLKNEQRVPLLITYTQLLIETSQAEAAEAKLTDLSMLPLDRDQKCRVTLLRCELHYLRQEYHSGLSLLSRSYIEPSSYTHALRARAHAELGNYEIAEDLFQMAANRLQESEDTYTVARIGTNLAAMLIKIREYQRAEEILRWAEDYQILSGDQAGLMVTRHNLQLIGT